MIILDAVSVFSLVAVLIGGAVVLLLFFIKHRLQHGRHPPPQSVPPDLSILLAPQQPPRLLSVTPDLELGQLDLAQQNQQPVLLKVDYPCPQIGTLLLEDGISIIINYKNYQQLPETRDHHTDCVICLGEFEAEESCCVLGRCRHVFHYHCAKSWLAVNPICPVCRSLAVPTGINSLVTHTMPSTDVRV